MALHQEAVDGPRIPAEPVKELGDHPERPTVLSYLPLGKAKAARRAFEAKNLVLVPPSSDGRTRGSETLGECVGAQHFRAGEDFSDAPLSAVTRLDEHAMKFRIIGGALLPAR